MKRIRVLSFVPTYYPQMGGGERIFFEVYTRMRKYGIDTDMITPNLGGKKFEEPAKGFRVFRVGKKKKNVAAKFFLYQFHMYRKALELISENEYDIVHNEFVLPTGLISTRIARKINKPIFFNVHHFGTGRDIMSADENPGIANPLMRYILKNANLIITTGQTQNKFLKWLFGHYPKNAITIPPGGPEVKKISSSKRESLRKKHGFAKNKVIFSVGRLTYRKRFDELIRTARIVCERVPNAIFLIGGKGEEMKKLQKIINKHALGDKVRLLGFIDEKELEELYLIADVFSYTSEFEGSGLVYTEAMSYSTPVAAYENDAVRDIIKDESYGIITKREPHALADAIIFLLKNKKII